MAVYFYPQGLAIGPDGSLYVADTNDHRIRRIRPDRTVVTVAGGGSSDIATVGDTGGYRGDGAAARDALLSFPTGVAVSQDGTIYIADSNNQRIRKVEPGGTISTVAGNGQRGAAGDGGPAVFAQLSYPRAVALGTAGGIVIADKNGHRLRLVDSDGIIHTVPGDSWLPDRAGQQSALPFNADELASLFARSAFASNGTMYVADPVGNHVLAARGRSG
jgi:sugar lactone lactonase YvrE